MSSRVNEREWERARSSKVQGAAAGRDIFVFDFCFSPCFFSYECGLPAKINNTIKGVGKYLAFQRLLLSLFHTPFVFIILICFFFFTCFFYWFLKKNYIFFKLFLLIFFNIKLVKNLALSFKKNIVNCYNVFLYDFFFMICFFKIVIFGFFFHIELVENLAL